MALNACGNGVSRSIIAPAERRTPKVVFGSTRRVLSPVRQTHGNGPALASSAYRAAKVNAVRPFRSTRFGLALKGVVHIALIPSPLPAKARMDRTVKPSRFCGDVQFSRVFDFCFNKKFAMSYLPLIKATDNGVRPSLVSKPGSSPRVTVILPFFRPLHSQQR